MKKNYSMRIASMLLVLVLLTTCVISGTFAKYVTKGDASDEARVAKWGVTISAPQEDDLFVKTYSNGTINSVMAADDAVAPGTEGSLAKFTIGGTPEVAVKVTYTADLTLTGWKVMDAANNEVIYCPLVFVVNGQTLQIAARTELSALEAAVEAEIAKQTVSYNAGEAINDVLEVSWSWAYSVNDAYDTILGNAAAAGNASTVKLDVTVTVTQVE